MLHTHNPGHMRASQPAKAFCGDCRAMWALRLHRRMQASRSAVAVQAAKAEAPMGKAAAKPRRKASDGKKPALAPLNKQAGPCCYGCGAGLQTLIPAGAGYVQPDKYEVKKRHKQLSRVLCERCSELCNGAMIPGVADFAQKVAAQQEQQLLQQQQQQQQQEGQEGEQEGQRTQLLGKLLITPEELRAQLTELRDRKAVVVLLVDLLDAAGTMMAKVRDIIGRNPLVLVGTKMDLLPEGCKPKDVAEWLADAAARRHLNVVSTHLVSSHTGEGMSSAVSKICRERKGRDVFVVGAANVGKSAFVRAMLREMGSFDSASFDPAASATGRYLPVESAMPGTTLGLIPLQAFETGGTLYDTPGVHLHHRIPHMLTPEELRLLHPRKPLRAFLPPSPLQLTQGDDAKDTHSFEAAAAARGLSSDRSAAVGREGRAGGLPKPKTVSASYIWSGLVRVDVLEAPPSTSLAFYGPATMRVFGLPLLRGDDVVELDASGDEGEQGGSAGPAQQVLMCGASVEARGGLVPHDVRVKLAGVGGPGRGAAADVAVSGLPGWIAVHAPFARRDVALRVWAPRGVEVFLRPPLPAPDAVKEANGDGDDELEGLLADTDMGQLLDGFRAGLDLKALGLEGEEDAVAQLMALDGFGGADGDGEWWQSGAEGQEWEEEEEGEEAGQLEQGQKGLVLQGTAEDVLQQRGRAAGSSSTSRGSSEGDAEGAARGVRSGGRGRGAGDRRAHSSAARGSSRPRRSAQ